MDTIENKPKKKKKKVNFANHIFRIILLVALSVFVGVSLFIFNSKTLLHNDYPTLGGYGVSVVISGSMEPTLNVNDLIIFQEQDQYVVDDIVIYAEKKSSVVHRLIEFKDDDKCITQGDANNTADKEIFINQIKGKVIFNIPYVGILINDVSKYIFLFIIIGLLSLSFIAEAKNRKIDKMRTNLLLEEIMTLRRNMDVNNMPAQNPPYPMQDTMQHYQNTNVPTQNYAAPQYPYPTQNYEPQTGYIPQENLDKVYKNNNSDEKITKVRDNILNKIKNFSE